MGDIVGGPQSTAIRIAFNLMNYWDKSLWCVVGGFLILQLVIWDFEYYFVKDIHGYKKGEQKSRLKTVDKTCYFIMEKCKLIAPQCYLLLCSVGVPKSSS